MALAFITVKNDSVIGANQYIPVIPDREAFTAVLDDTDNGVKDLFMNVNSHVFSEIMGVKPYVTATYDGLNVNGTLVNGTSTQATISLLSQSYQVDIVGGQFTFPIKLHQAVLDQHLTLNIRVDGVPYTFMEIAGRNSNVELTIYQDTNGVYNVVPSKAADLANYWQNSLVDMSYSYVDLATADELALHTLFNKVLPVLNLTLTPEEEAAILEIQNNLIPLFSTTIENLNGNLHYGSYKLHTQQGQQAMEKYIADRIEISKYFTLK
jgi:hypothetical protein